MISSGICTTFVPLSVTHPTYNPVFILIFPFFGSQAFGNLILLQSPDRLCESRQFHLFRLLRIGAGPSSVTLHSLAMVLHRMPHSLAASMVAQYRSIASTSASPCTGCTTRNRYFLCSIPPPHIDSGAGASSTVVSRATACASGIPVASANRSTRIAMPMSPAEGLEA